MTGINGGTQHSAIAKTLNRQRQQQKRNLRIDFAAGLRGQLRPDIAARLQSAERPAPDMRYTPMGWALYNAPPETLTVGQTGQDMRAEAEAASAAVRESVEAQPDKASGDTLVQRSFAEALHGEDKKPFVPKPNKNGYAAFSQYSDAMKLGTRAQGDALLTVMAMTAWPTDQLKAAQGDLLDKLMIDLLNAATFVYDCMSEARLGEMTTEGRAKVVEPLEAQRKKINDLLARVKPQEAKTS